MFSYQWTVISLLVEIEAGIHLDTGEVYARFQSLNPTNGLPPPVDIGMLPPENGTGRGQGHISYVIRADTNLVTTGTEIRNVAYITFDGAETIATDWVDPHNSGAGIGTNKQALVTIDADLPTSSVANLPSTATNANFAVSWAGSDIGAGVAGYDVFVSTNGSPYALWLANTPLTSEVFHGENGQMYCFYSLARDGTGLVQTDDPVVVCTQTLTNYPPVIEPIPNQFIAVGRQLLVTNVAWDPDVPLHFNLASGTPEGATINETNGVFRWQPVCFQGSSTNSITVWVTDSGTPPMSSAMTFTVRVDRCVEPRLGTLVLAAGDRGRLPLKLTAPSALTNLTMMLRLPAGRLVNPSLEITNWAMICTNSLTEVVSNAYLISLSSCPGRFIWVTNEMEQEGWLYVTAVSNQPSAILPLQFTDVVGRMPDGTPLTQAPISAGRVVVVGQEPLLEASFDPTGHPIATIYALSGTTNRLENRTDFSPLTPWSTGESVVIPTNQLWQEVRPAVPANGSLFLRGRRE